MCHQLCTWINESFKGAAASSPKHPNTFPENERTHKLTTSSNFNIYFMDETCHACMLILYRVWLK